MVKSECQFKPEEKESERESEGDRERKRERERDGIWKWVQSKNYLSTSLNLLPKHYQVKIVGISTAESVVVASSVMNFLQQQKVEFNNCSIFVSHFFIYAVTECL